MTPTTEASKPGNRFALLRLLYAAAPGAQVANTLARILADTIVPVSALGMKILTDGIVSRDDGRAIVGGIVMASAHVLNDGLNWAGMALHFSIIERTRRAIDEQLMSWAAEAPGLEHHERAEYHDRIRLLSDQGNQLAMLPQTIGSAVGIVARTIVTVALLLSIHPLLLALPIFGVPSLTASRRNTRRELIANDEVAPTRRRVDDLFDLATEATAAKEVRVFGLQETLPARHTDEWRVLDGTLSRAERLTAATAAVGWAVFALGYVAAIVLVVRQATDLAASVGDVALTLVLAGQMTGYLNYAAQAVSQLQEATKAATRHRWLADYTAGAVARTTPTDPKPVPARLTNGIRFEGVSFTYPGMTEPTLHEVNLNLPSGRTIALVGDNGAGKTTFVKLLCRMYEPTTGHITVDGTPLTAFTPSAWRERLSAAFQDHAHIELVARETVGIGDLAQLADERAVTEALERAAAADVIGTLPLGLETQLGRSFDGGVELSGGQWQKLALGRTMMRELPLVLLLDEPTAALDAQAEHDLFERYADAAARVQAAVGSITVLVSHRLSTVRMADLILVFANGRVVEQGAHEELMSAAGHYAELYELQARSYR